MDKKNEAAAALGRLGGLQRTQNLTKEQLSAIGRIGALKRWGTKRSGETKSNIIKEEPDRK